MRRPKLRASVCGCQNMLFAPLPYFLSPPTYPWKYTTLTNHRVHSNWPHRIKWWVTATLLPLQFEQGKLVPWNNISMSPENYTKNQLLMSFTWTAKKVFAKFCFDPLRYEKVCEISQFAQNPWVSRYVLQLAMSTASNYGQGEYKSTERERVRIVVSLGFWKCATLNEAWYICGD